LFGAPKLPGLARSLGQSAKIFKSEMKPEDKGDVATATPAEDTDSSVSNSSATSAADKTSTKS
jgi:sec-independent protein translocase protein TatA